LHAQLFNFPVKGAEADAEAAGGFFLFRGLAENPLDVLPFETPDRFREVFH
jgi:hypothetical protein